MTRNDVTRVLAAAAFVFACVLASTSHDATGFDFDEIMMIAMGFAGLAYIVADLKRERRLDADATAIASRLGAIESAIEAHNPSTIASRISAVEARTDALDWRDDMLELVRKVGEIEARIDHKPITQTRSKGKFVSPQSLQDEIDSLRAELARRPERTP